MTGIFKDWLKNKGIDIPDWLEKWVNKYLGIRLF